MSKSNEIRSGETVISSDPHIDSTTKRISRQVGRSILAIGVGSVSLAAITEISERPA